MKRTPNDPLNEIDAFRAQELLLQRATEGLSPEQAAELAGLGVYDDDSYDLAATAVDLALMDAAAAQESMPYEVAQRILLAAGAQPPRASTEQARITQLGTGEPQHAARPSTAGVAGAMGPQSATMVSQGPPTSGDPAATQEGMMPSATGAITGLHVAEHAPEAEPAGRARTGTQPPALPASTVRGHVSPLAGVRPGTAPIDPSSGSLGGMGAAGPGPGPGPSSAPEGYGAPYGASVAGPLVGPAAGSAEAPVGAPMIAPGVPPGSGGAVVPLAPRRSRAPMIAAWTAAALGLAAAAAAVVWATRQEPRVIVERVEVPAPIPAAPLPSAARAQLLAEAPDVITLPWSRTTDPAGQAASGDVVWSPSRQEGYMRFVGLAANDPKLIQYQLWIFDKLRDEAYPVDGGVFDVGPTGEIVIKISAKLRVSEPILFAITVEPPGGVVVSKRERVVVTAAAAKAG